MVLQTSLTPRFALTDTNGLILYATNSRLLAWIYSRRHRKAQVRAYDRHAAYRRQAKVKKSRWLERSDGIYNMEVSIPFMGRPHQRVFPYRSSDGHLSLKGLTFDRAITSLPDGKYRYDYPGSFLIDLLPSMPPEIQKQSLEALEIPEAELPLLIETFTAFDLLQSRAYGNTRYV
jgi:hypothetical protein